MCARQELRARSSTTASGSGEVAILGGTPGNALSLGWQRCAIAALASGIDLVNPPADENTHDRRHLLVPAGDPGVCIKGC